MIARGSLYFLYNKIKSRGHNKGGGLWKSKLSSVGKVNNKRRGRGYFRVRQRILGASS